MGNPYEREIEAATSENRVEDDWVLIFEICSKVTNAGTTGAKHAFQALIKRLRVSNARVQYATLQLFGALASNCGRYFKEEVCSREFYEAIFGLWRKQPQPQVVERLRELIQEWASEFQSDPSLSMMLKLYNDLKKEGFPFRDGVTPAATGGNGGSSSTSSPKAASKENDDISRAIALSLQESSQATSTSSSSQFSSQGSSSMYPTLGGGGSGSGSSFTQPSASAASASKVLFQVRALYDFQSQEDNEVSFKAGELVNVLDDSDENWWSGSTLCGSGLFPASFVTRDLTVSPEPEVVPNKASGSGGRSAGKAQAAKPRPEIREAQITLLLDMLHNADATVENEEEDKTLKELETECTEMKPLIADKISSIEREQAALQDLNQQFQDALAYYQQLMKETARPAATSAQLSGPRESAPPMQAYADEYHSSPVHAEPSPYDSTPQYRQSQQPQAVYHPVSSYQQPAAAAAGYPTAIPGAAAVIAQTDGQLSRSPQQPPYEYSTSPGQWSGQVQHAQHAPPPATAYYQAQPQAPAPVHAPPGQAYYSPQQPMVASGSLL